MYIYRGFLINCEYFNSLNENGDMAGICTSPYPSEKVGDSPPIPIPSQCGDSPSKRGQVRAIPTGTSLFAISSCKRECMTK